MEATFPIGHATKTVRGSGATPAAMRSIFADDLREAPYWWDVAAPVVLREDDLPRTVDVAIIGAGYTGLAAAIQTARAGRSTLVIDAGEIGHGCSTRNGAQISTSVKPGEAELAQKFGLERARAVREEGKRALQWIGDFIGEEGIECGFRRCGRFHAAHTPEAYEALAAAAEEHRKEGIEAHLVPRAEQHRELGSDFYFGGLVHPAHATLHPAMFHRGLLDRARAAGATVISHCAGLGLDRGRDRGRDTIELQTSRGPVTARDVITATNGYSGALMPWLQRRVIPIGSYVIATEPVPEDLMNRLFPTDRNIVDTRRVVYYYRPSPDRRRIVFGGRVSANETDPRISGPRLHAEMARIFPELADLRISHSWAGKVGYSFDSLPHCGSRGRVHYAASYCGSGVSMASYLGTRTGQRVAGLAEGCTAFDNLPFPTRPLYTGKPWFLPAVVAWYRWRDRREVERATRSRVGEAT